MNCAEMTHTKPGEGLHAVSALERAENCAPSSPKPTGDGEDGLTLAERVARVICCPSGTCCSRDACYAKDKSRSQLVDIHAAAKAVLAMIIPAIRQAWDKQPGPYSRTRQPGTD